MASFPKEASVVIVGLGGIVGSSVAWHLAKLGWENIVGIDKSAIPTDIGSTSHASDFCYMTAGDKFTTHTTLYSQKFYEERGNYIKKGGMEVARVDDDGRMQELRRKVATGKAFGTNVSMISPREAKEKFPLLEEDAIQGAMWDPDAGLVVPRSQHVVDDLVKETVDTGALQVFANTPALDIETKDGRVCGVHTPKGFIKSSIVVIAAGIWGPLIGEMAGVKVPLVPVEHPLLFFGPVDLLQGTGQDLVYPLFRDQGNSAYVRDTGDPETPEGGMLEWGYYEEFEPRMVNAQDIKQAGQGRLSPSMNELDLDQVMHSLERAFETVPILSNLGYDDKASFNGLLSVTPDGGSLLGESPEIRGVWLSEAVWIKDGPGVGKVIADWLTHGSPEEDPHGADIARFYPVQKTPGFVFSRSRETAQKIYNPPVHSREPYATERNLRRSPFWPREVELGGYFMEIGGWERAHGYKANEERLSEYMERVPVRENEWDNRHFWRVSNAEHLALSNHVGMINLSHFAIFDITGPDAKRLLEYLSVAKVDVPIGKAVYTNFLNKFGGIQADVTITRIGEDHFRLVTGGDAGNRDWKWVRDARDDFHYNAEIHDLTNSLATLGLWGPKAREVLERLVEDPEEVSNENFPFVTSKQLMICGVPVWALRISYVGELGWELYFPFNYGLRIWDAFYEAGVIPVGIETYANSRRMEKSLRLQGADLETEYNLYEAGLARPKVKKAYFRGKRPYYEQRQREHQPAYLCTLTMQDNTDPNGVARYPVGHLPVLDSNSKEVIVDSRGRRSYTTSGAYGPSLGKFIFLAYIPYELASEGSVFLVEYLGEHYPVKIEAVGYRALYDSSNERVKS